jgi:beta-mannosidase
MTDAVILSAVTLTEDWKFKQSDDTTEDAWLNVKQVPTNVHLDLIEHGKYVRSLKCTLKHGSSGI